MILYHVSYNTEKALDYTFIPRVPESIAFDEDDKIKRICFADSIKNCIIAKEGRLMQGARDIIVYKYEVDEENSNILVSRLVKDSEGYDIIEDIEDNDERQEVQNAVKEILSSIE